MTNTSFFCYNTTERVIYKLNEFELSIDTLINKYNPIDPIDYEPRELITMDNNENNFHNYRDPNLKPKISSRVKERLKKRKKILMNIFHK